MGNAYTTVSRAADLVPDGFTGHLRVLPNGTIHIEAEVGGVVTAVQISESVGVWILAVVNEQDAEELVIHMPSDKDQWPRFVKAIVTGYLTEE